MKFFTGKFFFQKCPKFCRNVKALEKLFHTKFELDATICILFLIWQIPMK